MRHYRSKLAWGVAIVALLSFMPAHVEASPRVQVRYGYYSTPSYYYARPAYTTPYYGRVAYYAPARSYYAPVRYSSPTWGYASPTWGYSYYQGGYYSPYYVGPSYGTYYRYGYAGYGTSGATISYRYWR